MTSISHDPAMRGQPQWIARLVAKEMWASLAIITMWLAVLFDAVFGPDIVSNANNVGGATTVVPSAVALALFAFLGTAAVARYGFHTDEKRKD